MHCGQLEQFKIGGCNACNVLDRTDQFFIRG
jgi:hypothetical protein